MIMAVFLVLSDVYNAKVLKSVLSVLNFISRVEASVKPNVETVMPFQELKSVMIRIKQAMMVVRTVRLKMDGSVSEIIPPYAKLSILAQDVETGS